MQIVWEGNWISPNGHATVCRNMARALVRRGIDVRLVSSEEIDESAYPGFLDADLLAMASRPQAPPEETIRIVHRVPTDVRRGNERLTVGMTYTEATRIPKEWVQAVNTEVDALVVAAPQSAQVVQASGVKRPVWVVPQGVDTGTFRPRYPGEPDELEFPGFRFLSVFEWAIRKGYDKLLTAFWDEFSSADDVCLILKTRYFGRSSVQREINRIYEGYLNNRARRRRAKQNRKRQGKGSQTKQGVANKPRRGPGMKTQRGTGAVHTVGNGTTRAGAGGSVGTGARVWARLRRSAWRHISFGLSGDTVESTVSGGDLVSRCSGASRSGLRFAPQNRAPIYIYDGILTDEELGRLYRHCSAFVLPTRGEGIGLPLLEAAATGLPLIVTGWGGQMDFLSRKDAYIVNYQLQKVPARLCRRWPSLRGMWAEPRRLSLRRQMRLVYNARHKVSDRAVRQQQHVMSHWSWDACAGHLVAQLEGAVGQRLGIR